MELNDAGVSTLVVGDLKVAVRIKWGALRKSIKKVNEAKTNSLVMEAITQTMTQHIIGIEGLTKDGKPVAWSEDVFDELPPWAVRDMFTALLNVAEAERPSDPLAVSTQPA